jgi:hypothetical protein
VRTSRRVATVIAAVTMFFIAAVGPAEAHYVYASGWVYTSETDCTKGRAEISHGYGGGYSKSDTEAAWRLIDPFTGRIYYCLGGTNRPPGYIRTHILLYRWSAAYQKWYVCRDDGLRYNSQTAQKFTRYVYWGTTTRCGNGYYGTMALHQVYQNGWHGNWLWSGYHWLPA